MKNKFVYIWGGLFILAIVCIGLMVIKHFYNRKNSIIHPCIPDKYTIDAEILEINIFEYMVKVVNADSGHYKGEIIKAVNNSAGTRYYNEVGDFVRIITYDKATENKRDVSINDMDKIIPVETTPAETTSAPKEDEVPVQTGGADGKPVEIKAKYIFYNGKLYSFSHEHFLQRTEKDFLAKWPDYKHIGYVVKEDNYTVPNREFETCGLKEGSKVYINPYDDKYIVVYDEIFWKMKISR